MRGPVIISDAKGGRKYGRAGLLLGLHFEKAFILAVAVAWNVWALGSDVKHLRTKNMQFK